MRNKIINITMDIFYLYVGIASTIVSIIFSYKFFVYNGYNPKLSFVVATLYMIFLNLLFEGGIACFLKSNRLHTNKPKYIRHKTLKRFNKIIRKYVYIGIIIITSWLILVSYSIISTIGGQYEQLSKLQKNNKDINITETSNLDQIPIIEDQIGLLLTQKKLFNDEIVTIKKRLDSVEDVEKSYRYKNTSAKNEERLDELRDKIVELDTKVIQYKNKIIEIKIKSNNIVEGNTYNYFERVIKIPAFIIQFVLSFFPSIVIDFFAPISFAMFLFRKRGE